MIGDNGRHALGEVQKPTVRDLKTGRPTVINQGDAVASVPRGSQEDVGEPQCCCVVNMKALD